MLDEKLPQDSVDAAMADAGFTDTLGKEAGKVTKDKRASLQELLAIKQRNKSESRAPIVSQGEFFQGHITREGWGARRKRK